MRSDDAPTKLGEPPYPGSDEALDKGCICPVLDNGHGNVGLARDRGGWIIVIGCPMHSRESDVGFLSRVVPDPDSDPDFKRWLDA